MTAAQQPAHAPVPSSPSSPAGAPGAGGPPHPGAARRAVRGGIGGNYVDQFDIFLPVVALAPASADLFGSDALAANAGLVFVATLLGRPLGAALFGPLADRIGRTSTTRVALAGVALTTLLIALVPGHEVLGAGTLAIVVALRFLGGIFIGGEYTSAIPLAMEWSAPHRRGLLSGTAMSMSPLANATISALVLLLLSVLDPASYSAWGWRLPFLAGAALAGAMLWYYRRGGVADSAAWTGTAKRPRPLRDVLFGAHRRALGQVLLMMTGLWLLTNMSVPTLATALQGAGELDARAVSFMMMCGTAVSAGTMLALGHVSTSAGRRATLVAAGVVAAVAAPVTYAGVFTTSAVPVTVLLVVALQVVAVSGYGPVGAYLAERFPTAVRSSGYGVGYSLSIVLPALYPYYLPPLQAALGERTAVAALLCLGGVLLATGAALGPRTGAHAPLP
ncbi:MFS transporter [Promicromonospora sukumoe]|uniref:MFS transporter n=1 Tax=Promicromonospora sukumoe TaxID=88382 RepID=UPI00036B3189|nr:MFS transporter [Promicromonospora sukumoe]